MSILLIRRQRRPCLLAIDDGLSLAGQHAGRDITQHHGRLYEIQWTIVKLNSTELAIVKFCGTASQTDHIGSRAFVIVAPHV